VIWRAAIFVNSMVFDDAIISKRFTH